MDVRQTREQRRQYIDNINPTGRIPAIKDNANGVVLYESPAILQYLADRYGKQQYYPSDVRQRAKINEYLHWHHEHTRFVYID